MNLSQALRWIEPITQVNPIPSADIWLKLDGTDIPALSLPAQSQYIADSKFGTVLQFNGSNLNNNFVKSGQYVLAKSYDKISICGWYKGPYNSGVTFGLADTYDFGIAFFIQGRSSPKLAILNGTTDIIQDWESISGTSNQWNFYVLVFDRLGIKKFTLYSNGLQVRIPGLSPSVVTDSYSSQLTFGSYYPNSSMSNVRVYPDKALTQEEVSDLYHEFD